MCRTRRSARTAPAANTNSKIPLIHSAGFTGSILRRGAVAGIASRSRDASPLCGRQEKSPARPSRNVPAKQHRRRYSLRGEPRRTREEAAQLPPWPLRKDDSLAACTASRRVDRLRQGARPQRVIRKAGSPPVQTGMLLRKNRRQKNGRIIQAARKDERRNAWDAS